MVFLISNGILQKKSRLAIQCSTFSESKVSNTFPGTFSAQGITLNKRNKETCPACLSHHTVTLH
jgi:hypothetical protein